MSLEIIIFIIIGWLFINIPVFVLFFLFIKPTVDKLESIMYMLQQLSVNLAGKDDIIEDIGHGLDHISRQVDSVDKSLYRFGKQVDGMAQSVRILASEKSKDD